MNNFIEIKDLTKIYYNNNLKPHTALDHVSISIPSGQALALLGPNGAGKSTLINILASIINKTYGKIKIGKFDIDSDKLEIRRMIGVMPQDINLDVFLCLDEYLKIYAGYYGINIGDDDIDNYLDKVDLLKRKKSKVRELSGGMKRRFALIKAFVHDPAILILDEPTAAVDIDLSRKIMNFLKEFKAAGKNIILTTHQFSEVEELCDRAIIIDKGKVLLDDLVDSVLPKIHKGFSSL